jgi:hypothetical protein
MLSNRSIDKSQRSFTVCFVSHIYTSEVQCRPPHLFLFMAASSDANLRNPPSTPSSVCRTPVNHSKVLMSIFQPLYLNYMALIMQKASIRPLERPGSKGKDSTCSRPSTSSSGKSSKSRDEWRLAPGTSDFTAHVKVSLIKSPQQPSLLGYACSSLNATFWTPPCPCPLFLVQSGSS